MRWTWWRARKVANAAAWQLMFFAIGILAGVALVAFLPGMPWSAIVEPRGATDAEALDLAAQRSMASAAWWMVTVAGVSSAVGALGLWLIYGTLEATRRSAEAAEFSVKQADLRAQNDREMSMAQFRAYVVVSDIEALFDGDFGTFEFRWTVFNTGQSPATTVNAVIRPSLYIRNQANDWEPVVEIAEKYFLADLPAGQSLTKSTVWAFEMPELERPIDEFEVRLQVAGRLLYFDVFGQPLTVPFAFIRDFDPYESFDEPGAMTRRPENTLGDMMHE